jgi:hypothetical protein
MSSAITYNLNIPASGNNPSDDQPLMDVNTNAVNTILAVNHYSFNETNGGKHFQVDMPTQGAEPTPASGVLSGEGCFITNTVTAGTTEEFYQADGQTDLYQITRTNHAFFSLFGDNTNNYNSVGADFTGGWTFLPGGLLLQYGFVNDPEEEDFDTVQFPVTFTTGCFSITTTAVRSSTNVDTIYIKSVSASSFQYFNTSDGGITGFYWIAIGS